jgi:hypothetical protein
MVGRHLVAHRIVELRLTVFELKLLLDVIYTMSVLLGYSMQRFWLRQ